MLVSCLEFEQFHGQTIMSASSAICGSIYFLLPFHSWIAQTTAASLLLSPILRILYCRLVWINFISIYNRKHWWGVFTLQALGWVQTKWKIYENIVSAQLNFEKKSKLMRCFLFSFKDKLIITFWDIMVDKWMNEEKAETNEQPCAPIRLPQMQADEWKWSDRMDKNKHRSQNLMDEKHREVKRFTVDGRVLSRCPCQS